MKVYTAKDVARLLDLSIQQIRSYARAGFLQPERGPRGEYRFSFQDLVLLRTAKGLVASRIPPRKVRRALSRLRQQLPSGSPLTGVLITSEGDEVLVRDGPTVWHAESGQSRFDFDPRARAEGEASSGRVLPHETEPPETEQRGEDWFAIAGDLETAAPDDAREAYRRALELEPAHVDARINLGRLLHEAGFHRSAESHYRLALLLRPGDGIASFNLAVCLEDQERLVEAVEAYRRTIENDPRCADAYYNVARLYEKLGDSAAALTHLTTYRKLTEGT